MLLVEGVQKTAELTVRIVLALYSSRVCTVGCVAKFVPECFVYEVSNTMMLLRHATTLINTK